jgi:hypothetical protein
MAKSKNAAAKRPAKTSATKAAVETTPAAERESVRQGVSGTPDGEGGAGAMTSVSTASLDMTPEEKEEAARKLAELQGAEREETREEDEATMTVDLMHNIRWRDGKLYRAGVGVKVPRELYDALQEPMREDEGEE